MKMLKVRDKPNLYRDAHSKAILVDDPTARINYVNHRAIAEKTKFSTEELKLEVDQIKQDMQDIKHMLQAIAGKIK